MSDRATAWARTIKCGSPGRKLVLATIASHMAPHDGEADDLHCGYPGQDLLIDECEMSERALRDHLSALVLMGLIQRKKRYKFNGERTSDWYRLPVHNRGDLGVFPKPADHTTPREWQPTSLPAESAGSQKSATKPDKVGELPADSASTTGNLLPVKETSLEKDLSLSDDDHAATDSAPLQDERETSLPTASPEPQLLGAKAIADALQWEPHKPRTPQQLARLHAPLQAALDAGWTEPQLLAYCNHKIQDAEKYPGTFLRGALEPKRLADAKPAPRSRTRGINHIGGGDTDRDYTAPIDVASPNSLAVQAARQAAAQAAARKRFTAPKPYLPHLQSAHA